MLEALRAVISQLESSDELDVPTPLPSSPPSPPPSAAQSVSSSARRKSAGARSSKVKVLLPGRNVAAGARRRLSALERDNNTLKARIAQLIRVRDKIAQAEVRLRGIAARWEEIRLDRDIELTCAICLSVMRHPYIVPGCHHVFCFTCIYKSISVDKETRKNSTCPSCRGTFTDPPTRVPAIEHVLCALNAAIGSPSEDECTAGTGSFDTLFPVKTPIWRRTL
ncbi:hypothetical protein OF83DRAFT_1174815 [Amylostereum chailletii]|nr:hypothetical protein OF83DRAFT_1174815 [Amylostereum chailletii]